MNYEDKSKPSIHDKNLGKDTNQNKCICISSFLLQIAYQVTVTPIKALLLENLS